VCFLKRRGLVLREAGACAPCVCVCLFTRRCIIIEFLTPQPPPPASADPGRFGAGVTTECLPATCMLSQASKINRATPLAPCKPSSLHFLSLTLSASRSSPVKHASLLSLSSRPSAICHQYRTAASPLCLPSFFLPMHPAQPWRHIYIVRAVTFSPPTQ